MIDEYLTGRSPNVNRDHGLEMPMGLASPAKMHSAYLRRFFT